MATTAIESTSSGPPDAAWADTLPLDPSHPGLRRLFTLHHAGRLTVLRKLEAPAALPALFEGLRVAAGLSVVGAIVGDFFFKQGDPGIGILIDTFRARLQSPELFASIILASLLGVAVFLFFGLLSRRVVGRWYNPDAGR